MRCRNYKELLKDLIRGFTLWFILGGIYTVFYLTINSLLR